MFVTLLLVALAASAKMWLITNAFLEDADAWLYMSVGNEIAQGAVLFQDVWCDKPAGIFYFYALLIKLGLKPQNAIAVSNALLIWPTTALLFVAVTLWYNRVTAALVVLGALFYVSAYYLNEAGGLTEPFVVIFALGCICTLRQGINGSYRWCCLAGACGTIAFLFKQPGISVSIAALVTLFLGRNIAHRKVKIIAFLVGAAIVAAVVAGYFLANGALQAAFEGTFVLPLGFLWNDRGMYSVDHPYMWSRYLRAWEFLSVPAVLSVVAGIDLFGRLLTRTNRGTSSLDWRNPYGMLIVLWLTADCLFTHLISIPSIHYFVQIIPSLSLAAGYAVHRFLIAYPKRWYSRICFPRLACIVLIAAIAFKPIQREWHNVITGIYRMWITPEQSELHLLAEWIASNSTPNDRIFVWGKAQGVVTLADRRLTRPHAYWPYYFLVGSPPLAGFEALIDQLERQSPALIVSASGGMHSLRLNRVPTATTHPGLASLTASLNERYALVQTIGNYHVYGPKPPQE